MPRADAPIKWAARVRGVREVTLRGSADLNYWQRRLAAQCLTPRSTDGRAQVLIVSAALRFTAVRFAERSVSVLVDPSASAPRRSRLEARVTLSGFIARVGALRADN